VTNCPGKVVVNCSPLRGALTPATGLQSQCPHKVRQRLRSAFNTIEP
jgi:hypothetical protein